MHHEHQALYRALCHRLCGTHKRPVILVHWSDVIERERLMRIRVALAAIKHDVYGIKMTELINATTALMQYIYVQNKL